MSKSEKKSGPRTVADNRKARFNYEILETYEAGIALTGTEVKSLRNGKANLTDAFGIVKDGEVYLLNLHISPYEQGNIWNHEPTRPRKLLLHKTEIGKLARESEAQGHTLVPLRMYASKGNAKVELAVVRGKRQYDKREAIARRDAAREVDRAVKEAVAARGR